MTAGGMRRVVRRDGGFVSAEWAIGVVVLIVPVLLLVALLPSWAAQREAAGAAAREAARVAAASPAARAEAGVSAATSLLVGRGLDLSGVRITVDVPPADTRVGAVTSSVHIPGRAAQLPLFGPVTGPPATASHVVHLDPHRSLP